METNAGVHSSLSTCHEINFSCLSPTILFLLLLLLLLVSWLITFLKCTFTRLEFITHYILVKRIGDEIILKKSQNLHIHSMHKWFIISTLNRISSPVLTSHNLLMSLKGTNANSQTLLLTLRTPWICTQGYCIMTT
jgi:hypothetical protein